jgi:hypothetical protein
MWLVGCVAAVKGSPVRDIEHLGPDNEMSLGHGVFFLSINRVGDYRSGIEGTQQRSRQL